MQVLINIIFMQKDTRIIFVTGGVLSSLGKGVIASSLGNLLKSQGLKVTVVKVDPYLNIDAGTMSPFQHGEVFVTEDGAETDLDMGYYERFLDCNLGLSNHITSGKVFQAVISRERRGDYLGSTVQVIPHVTDEIKRQITFHTKDNDVVIVEIGGTVGDIESQPFLEAVRQLKYDYPYALCVHVTLVPYIKTSEEVKTKPTQHSVKELRSLGIIPDFIVTRSDKPLEDEHKRKIALFANLDPQFIFESPNVSTIYKVPLLLEEQGMTRQILQKIDIEYKEDRVSAWNNLVQRIESLEKSVKLAVVGKYSSLSDAYKSIDEALLHAGIARNVKVDIDYLSTDKLEDSSIERTLGSYDGLLIPGGFGQRGLEQKIAATKYCRENKVPFFGICLGMQVAVIEFARNVAGIKGAQSAEFEPEQDNPLFHLVTDWIDSHGHTQWRGTDHSIGGTMRLGAQSCILKEGSKVRQAYQVEVISERHRHRYELNVKYVDAIEKAGMNISGISSHNGLSEVVEISDHPWFVACQYHPEFVSKPLTPHPLFISFVDALVKSSK